MKNIILIAILALIIGLAARYVYKAKKRGTKCIGCPSGCPGASNCSGCCGACKRD